MANADLMEKIVSLCKRRGFIFPGSEIYGGFANSWDYGPVGVELKNNIKQLWWKRFVQQRDDMVGIDAALIMKPNVWEASGHLKNFTDPLVECKNCHNRFRLDKLVEDASGMPVQQAFENYMEEWWGQLEPKIKAHIMDQDKTIMKLQTENADLMRKLTDKGIDFKKVKISNLNYKFFTYDSVKSEFKDFIMVQDKGITAYFEKLIDTKSLICANCGKQDFTHSTNFNLMFKTFIGPAEEQANVAYFRPETAQAMFVDFKNVLDTSRKTVPFGIGQIGKAFRNEITPGNFIFRTREFEQMEIEYFIAPPKTDEDWNKYFEMWRENMISWITKDLGIKKENIHELEVPKEDLAHYSKRTIDFEYKFPFGTDELYGLAYRTDFDLKNHSKASGQNLEYTDPQTNEKYVPHVIEPTWGVDRSVLAVLCESFDDSDPERVVLHLPKHLAPYKVAVFPLLKNKPELVAKAREIYSLLTAHSSLGPIAWDERGNVGKRYYSQDEIGTPFCITVDFDTIEKDGTVTVRNRDTKEQPRVKIEELKDYITKALMQ